MWGKLPLARWNTKTLLYHWTEASWRSLCWNICLRQLKFYLDMLQVTVTCCKGNQWVLYLCLRFRAQTYRVCRAYFPQSPAGTSEPGHPYPSCHLCQPLGSVSETLGDEKYVLVMMAKWFPSPGCKSGIHTAHCPGSFYQEDRFFLKLPSWTDRNLPDTVFCTLCIHGTCASHFFSTI